MSGLEILAGHHIQEGVPLCVDLIEVGRWGLDNRIKRCLTILRTYGGAARSVVPRLRQLESDLAARGWKPDRIEQLNIPGLIEHIETDDDPPTLRPLRGPA